MKTQSFQRRQGGAEARELPALRAGQVVTLRNGQQGKVQFVSAAMKVARVSMSDGKTTRTVKLTEIVPVGDGLDVSRPTLRQEREGWGTRARLALQDIDPEEGFDEQEEFACAPAEDCGAGSRSDGGVKYVPPHDEPEEHEEYAEDGRTADHDSADDFSKPEIRRTMERARPVAGQRPLVSDRVAPRAERGIGGPPKPVRREDVAKLGKKDKESGRPVLQPSGSIGQNERLAAQAAPELETRLSRLAARVPGAKFVRLRPQKNPERLREKVRGEDKPAETISDYLASQVSADSVEAKDQIIAELKKHFNVVEVEDSFLKGREEKAGYPSANVQVMLSNGSTAEVQIVPREVQQATEQSHHFYKMGRNARDAGKTALSRHYFDQAKAINERALARFRMRNSPGRHGATKPQPKTLPLMNTDRSTDQH
ncbi:MAG: hypothetical protein LAP21_09500 [Acidobacteriia bacterium]|nr:hypothetical protein [Terriglobia bacterium]